MVAARYTVQCLHRCDQGHAAASDMPSAGAAWGGGNLIGHAVTRKNAPGPALARPRPCQGRVPI
jgi:hypothetical protein